MRTSTQWLSVYDIDYSGFVEVLVVVFNYSIVQPYSDLANWLNTYIKPANSAELFQRVVKVPMEFVKFIRNLFGVGNTHKENGRISG